MTDYFLAFAAAFAFSSAIFFLSVFETDVVDVNQAVQPADLIEETDRIVKAAFDSDIDGNFSVKLLKRFGARPKK